MSGLVAFVRARLDEREAKAKAAAGLESAEWTAIFRYGVAIEAADGGIVVYDEGCPSEPQAAHIAAHAPAWALADVAAKRAIVDAYEPVSRNDGLHEPEYAYGWAEALGTAVRQLAAIDRGHPDYRQEWAP